MTALAIHDAGGTAINGFNVDIESLSAAAGKIHLAVVDGTLEKQCIAYATDYGHAALAAAVVTFTDDADRAVTQHAAKAEALASGLTEQAQSYSAVDGSVQGQLTGPGLMFPGAPLAPFQAHPGLTPSPSAGPFTRLAGGS